ncbi:IS1-like element transposase [Shigella dysenteriae]
MKGHSLLKIGINTVIRTLKSSRPGG